MIAIPGPSVLFIVGRALTSGRRTALLTVVGNTVGEYGQVVCVAFGIGALIEQSVAAFTVLKIVGAVYLVYLGVRTFRERRSLRAFLAVPGDRKERWAVVRGVFVGISNPKTIIFLAAILPQFANRSEGSVAGQILLLGLLFSSVAIVSDSLWALGAHGFGSWFARSPRRLELIGGAGGLAIIAVGVAVALTGRKD
ncbi:MAG TPA: LysE family translocator [Acidimicrobiales bacterium]|nr:LysE family translocator [Acidimicrobiales bacterium]